MFDLKARVREVLDSSHLMSFAVTDTSGVWVSDVIFIYDDSLKIYWMSDPETRHSQAILTHPQIAGTITASTKSKEPNFGIQFSGEAKKIEGPRYDLALKHFAKRGREAPTEDEDVLEGDSWYELTLEKIRLIDEANFGFDTQDVSL